MSSGRFSSSLDYPIDVEHMWEMDRLERQGRLITEATGFLPPSVVPKDGQVIIDLACGPGEWAAQVARSYPRCQVIGVDISERMILFARYRAHTQQIPNVQFEIADLHKPLAFASNAVDIIHARFLTAFQSTKDWPLFFAECFRVLRPGGSICSTEFEDWGVTSSAALTQLNTLIVRLFQRRGQCFLDTGGEHIGILATQTRLLQEASFFPVHQRMHVLDYSAGTPAHEPMAGNLAAFTQLCEKALVSENIIDQEEYAILSMQLLKELYIESFHGILTFQSAWGKKPFELLHIL